MNRELRTPGLLTDTPLEDEPMNRDYEIQRQLEGYAAFVQGLKDDGAWDSIERMALPRPDGPLNKADLEQIWREKTLTTFEFSIGPAVDLAKLDTAPFPDA
jgi:hypothetical protein